MNDTTECTECPLACTEVCAAQPSPQAARVALADALSRFEKEAVRGVCATGRYRMPYYTWGSGPPLLFIHGVSDHSHSFVLPISRLSAHFRCIAYDLPSGRGDGARLRHHSHAALVADVWALLDHLGLTRSYVFGSSFGSTIALTALRERPERLPRAILQGGLAHRPLRRAERNLARLAQFLPGAMALAPWRRKVLQATSRDTFSGQPDEVWEYFLKVSGTARIAAVSHQALLLHQLDLRPLLPDVRQPILLICGELDRVVPRHYDEVLLQGLPNAGRVIVEGCGHQPSYTHPEVLAELVRVFLTPVGNV
jgi:pimeloyl-ACP methyl ester carboxylesterase